MRAKHGYRYVTKIPRENAERLTETLKEFAKKDKPSENDRARNMRYNVRGMCGLTVSLTNGSISIDSDMNGKELIEFMSEYLHRDIIKEFERNMRCTSVGTHSVKGIVTSRFLIDVKKPGVFPLTLSMRVCKYGDMHANLNNSDGTATIKDYNKHDFDKSCNSIAFTASVKIPEGSGEVKNCINGYTGSTAPTIPPQTHNLSDIEIIRKLEEIMKENNSVSVGQLQEKFKKDCSTIYRRLKKFENRGILKVITKRPLLFSFSDNYIIRQ